MNDYHSIQAMETIADEPENYTLGRAVKAADLSGADLSGVKNTATPEEVARLDAVREIILKRPDRLRMSTWHSREWTPDHTPQEEHSCGSAHCIAGWLQALSDDVKIREMEPEAAGRKLCPSAAHMFFTADEVALEWMKSRAYAQKDAPVTDK